MSRVQERFQANGLHWQVYKSKLGLDYTALAKVVPFVHFGQPLFEPWDHDVWFEFGSSAEDAYGRLRTSLGLELHGQNEAAEIVKREFGEAEGGKKDEAF